MKTLNKNNRSHLILVAIVILSIPAILTQTGYAIFDFSNTGQIGDTIGGITAPFIGLLSAFLIYEAFIVQVKANRIQSKNYEFGIALKLIDDLEEKLTVNNKRFKLDRHKDEISNANYYEIIRFWNEMKNYRNSYRNKIVLLMRQVKYFGNYVQKSENLSPIEESQLLQKASLAFGSDLINSVDALLLTESDDLDSDDKQFYSYARKFRESTLDDLLFHLIDMDDFDDQ